MTLEEVKTFIRVDFNDDDELIKLIIEVAQDYVSNGFSEYDETNPSHKILMLKAVKTLYDNRDEINDNITSSIKLQQMLYEEVI
jgi:uncharacterized phage protein (possible DNA packaging)